LVKAPGGFELPWRNQGPRFRKKYLYGLKKIQFYLLLVSTLLWVCFSLNAYKKQKLALRKSKIFIF
jgi:hypothetical protein